MISPDSSPVFLVDSSDREAAVRSLFASAGLGGPGSLRAAQGAYGRCRCLMAGCLCHESLTCKLATIWIGDMKRRR